MIANLIRFLTLLRLVVAYQLDRLILPPSRCLSFWLWWLAPISSLQHRNTPAPQRLCQALIAVKLLLQPEDLIHDDQSKLKLEVVDRKFRGTNFIYTLKTKKGEHLPVFVHSHHIHQHEKSEQFGVKSPIYIDHLVCF